jgi:hypothetical protein
MHVKLKQSVARWRDAAAAVASNRAARDLLKDERSEVADRTIHKKKKKKKKAELQPMASICEETVVRGLSELGVDDVLDDVLGNALGDLPEEPKSTSQEVASSSVASALACVICFHGASEFACVPCGHRCLCQRCSEQFKSASAKCPMCREPMLMVMKVYG